MRDHFFHSTGKMVQLPQRHKQPVIVLGGCGRRLSSLERIVPVLVCIERVKGIAVIFIQRQAQSYPLGEVRV